MVTLGEGQTLTHVLQEIFPSSPEYAEVTVFGSFESSFGGLTPVFSYV
jgi:hypothetical protein